MRIQELRSWAMYNNLYALLQDTIIQDPYYQGCFRPTAALGLLSLLPIPVFE